MSLGPIGSDRESVTGAGSHAAGTGVGEFRKIDVRKLDVRKEGIR